MTGVGFPIRLSVAVSVQGPAVVHVLEFNRSLVDLGDDAIEFLPGGTAHPHATYLMGRVEDGRRLTHILEGVELFAKALLPNSYYLTRPYYANGASGFIFSAIESRNAFIQERILLHDRIGRDITLEKHGGLTNVPHVTLGYRPEGGDFPTTWGWPDKEVALERSEVIVSRVGDLGTSVEVLQAFKITR